jgi:hypothetical protein
VDAGNNFYGLKNPGNGKYVTAENKGIESLYASRDKVGSS